MTAHLKLTLSEIFTQKKSTNPIFHKMHLQIIFCVIALNSSRLGLGLR